MHVRLKPINEQAMVIVGASSGIGLVTARMAARRGAGVVLVARNESDLRRAVDEIRDAGGRAVYQVADVARVEQVERVAETALREFGRIDTWVNNAAVAVYGRIMEVALEDMRRQFDVNYWGQVHGSRTAVAHLRKDGGALINVASALADRAIPLQGNYSAAKHALKAFTDALRMELEEEGAPVSVTLVKPGSIDTPLFDKSKSYLGVEPQPVPPVYAPEVAAEAILHCAQQPVRDIIVGGMGRMLSVADTFPRVADRYMERTTFESQQTGKPVGDRPNNLYDPVEYDGGERGRNWSGRTKPTSVYTAAALHPRVATATVLGAGAALLAGAFALRGGRRNSERRGEEGPPRRESTVLTLGVPGSLAPNLHAQGVTMVTTVQERFHDVLAAPGRAPEIPESADAYGWLIGDWELEVRRYWGIDVSMRGIKGEIHFEWVLEGRAVQDVWIMPRRADRTGEPDKQMNMYGTTLRVWDPTIEAWRITWRNPAGDHHEEQIGRRVGADIVQVGVRPNGTPTRWMFTEITADSFRWTGESLAVDGKTWNLEGEFRATRVR